VEWTSVLIDWLIVLEKEQEEKREAEQSVATYKRQLASLREKVASIDVEIEQYRAITANLRRGVSRP
jgi:kinetochore protein Spc25